MVQSEWFGPLVRYLEQARTALGTYVPNLLGATVLLLVGWLVARILRALANRLIPRIYRILPARADRPSLCPRARPANPGRCPAW